MNCSVRIKNVKIRYRCVGISLRIYTLPLTFLRGEVEVVFVAMLSHESLHVGLEGGT